LILYVGGSEHHKFPVIVFVSKKHWVRMKNILKLYYQYFFFYL